MLPLTRPFRTVPYGIRECANLFCLRHADTLRKRLPCAVVQSGDGEPAGPVSGSPPGRARLNMAGMEQQAEAWTATMRAEQASMDIGAQLGPADPTAYTVR